MKTLQIVLITFFAFLIQSSLNLAIKRAIKINAAANIYNASADATYYGTATTVTHPQSFAINAGNIIKNSGGNNTPINFSFSTVHN